MTKTTSQVTVRDQVFRELALKIGRLSKARVKVGCLQSGAGNETAVNSDITMAELWAIHEFGAPRANIPARKPLRTTFEEPEGAQELLVFLAKTATAIVNNKLDPEKALDVLGLWAVAKVQARIVMGLPPPIRPATVKAKGSSGILIDTGQLKASCTHEVIK